MKLPLSVLPPEYDDWVDGLEPAWTSLDSSISDALLAEPPARNGPIRLAEDLTDGELAQSTFLNNALALLRAAAQGKGMKLTARGNLTRAEVSAMRAAMHWPGCRFEERWRSGKLLSEHHVEELRLLRALLEEAGLARRNGARFRATPDGRAALEAPRAPLQAALFRIAFWRVSLNVFGAGAFRSWPQQQIGFVLWSLSVLGDRWQDTATLMRLSVLPDETVSATGMRVAPLLFETRILRPLRWFGLLECRQDPAPFVPDTWRKCALFDRFVRFDKALVQVRGALH